MSETTQTKIAMAFVKAQKSFSPALKTSINPHFKSRYVGLDGCVEAVIDALNDNGIALMQHTSESDSGVIVETVFLHESGETLNCGKLHVPASKHDAQGYGSALTYARRYSLMAACGIAPEDDDGNAASKSVKGVTHRPVDNPDFQPDEEEKEFLMSVADSIFAAKPDAKKGAELLYNQNLDSDQITWIWAKLGSESAYRKAIKDVHKGKQ